MPRQSLCTLLGQSPKVDEQEFWTFFDQCCQSQHQWAGKLSVKAKQNLISALKFSCTSADKTNYIDSVIKWIDLLPSNPDFCANFSQSDAQFFTAFSNLVASILQHQEPAFLERQSELLAVLNRLYDSSQLFRSLTGITTAKSVVSLLSTRSEPSALISRSISLLLGLTDLEEVSNQIKAGSEQIIKSISASTHPRIQLQLIELLWRLKIPISDVTFEATDSQTFLPTAHQIMAKLQASIISLQFESLVLPSKTLESGGWIDVGTEDLLICYSDIIAPIPFTSVGGLDSENNELTITLDSPVQSLDMASGQAITARMKEQLSPDVMKAVFARISHGESQTTEAEPKPASEQVSESKPSKSSIAIFVPSATQNLSTSTAEDNSLFVQPNSQPEEEEEEIPPPTIELGGEAQPEEESQLISAPEPPKQEKPSAKFSGGEDLEVLMKHSAKMAECLNSGLDYLTKSRYESIDQLQSSLSQKVEAFKEDMHASLKDKEHGSLKQLDVSRARFQANIQQFKKKEASIHQSLLGYEEETKEISSRLTAIQRKIRENLQKNRIDLEDELNKLRKQIRSQNEAESDAFDDDSSPRIAKKAVEA